MNSTKSFPWTAIVGGSIVIVCLAIVSREPIDATPEDSSNVPPVGAPDLRTIFALNPNKAEAKQHARSLGEIAASVADILAYDGEKGDQARITTGHQLAVFRNDVRDMTTNGFRFSSRYPQLVDVLEKFLDERAGKDGGKLTAEARAKWIDAFRVLHRSAAYACRKL